MGKLNTLRLMAFGFALLFLSSSINSIFYSIAYAFDASTGTYIFRGDFLADFFKILFSYPSGKELGESSYHILPKVLKSYVDSNPYGGVSELAAGNLTHFHITPLSTAILLAFVEASNLVGIWAAFSFAFITGSLLLVGGVRWTSATPEKFIVLLATFLISYPFLFVLQRGNLHSFLSCLALILAVIALQKKQVFFAIMLFALAVNIRPNLFLFIPIFYFWPFKAASRPLLASLVTGAICWVAFLFVNHTYSEFSINHFIQGVSIYERLYVVGDGGFAYSVSIFSFVKFLCKLMHLELQARLVNSIILLSALVLVAYATVLQHKDRLSRVEYIFILAAVNALGTPVFADYHLMIFFVTIFLVAYDADSDPRLVGDSMMLIMIFLASVFMVSPLNYVQWHGVYVLPFLKTIVAGFAVSLIFLPNRLKMAVASKFLPDTRSNARVRIVEWLYR